jgi:CDGSH-type Zn-finger protein
VTAMPEQQAPQQRVVVRPCADGPLLVRGADVVEDAQGTAHAVTRPVVALCTCDKSSRLPWCDGTHKAVARAKRRKATPGG